MEPEARIQLEDALLLGMFRSYFNDETRYDVQGWVRNECANDKEKNPVEMKMMVDKMEQDGWITRKMGTSYQITPKGINRVETKDGLLTEAEKKKTYERRRDILKAIKSISEGNPQGTAQFGKVMEVTRLNRNETGPHMRLAEERGSIVAATAGFYRLTEMGDYEIDALENLYPTESKKPDAPSGPVSLANIKFFD